MRGRDRGDENEAGSQEPTPLTSWWTLLARGGCAVLHTVGTNENISHFGASTAWLDAKQAYNFINLEIHCFLPTTYTIL